jgi:vacuolar protein sorting-associated protein VTA1
VRFYMTQKIISKGLHLADKECTAYTTDLMEKLEQTKAEYPTEDALHDETVAHAYCEQFALQTFAKADNEIRSNKVTEATADTLLASSTFFELLSLWKNPPEAEIKSKMTFAKYHALRIAKAIKAGEDPNLSNPKQETPVAPALDPNDPEVQNITEDGQQSSIQNPYQPYVESAPNTSAHPSPNLPATKAPQTPSLDIPSVPTGYTQPAPGFPPHQDVSPISQPTNSRKSSIVSAGGGYFPRVDVPTFTSDNAPAGLPTAPSMADQTMRDAYETAPALPAAPSPQPPQGPDFYQSQPFQQPTPQAPPSQQMFQPQQPIAFAPSPVPPPQQYAYPPQQPQQAFAPPAAPQISNQGTFNTDEDSVLEAQKHAKWAISALNFEDVPTAVKELRTALRALGAD